MVCLRTMSSLNGFSRDLLQVYSKQRIVDCLWHTYMHTQSSDAAEVSEVEDAWKWLEYSPRPEVITNLEGVAKRHA